MLLCCCPSRTARRRHKRPSSPRASAEMKPMALLNSTSVLHFIKENIQYHAQNKVNKSLPKQRHVPANMSTVSSGENELALALVFGLWSVRTREAYVRHAITMTHFFLFRSLSLLMLILLTQRNNGAPTNPPRHRGRSRRFALLAGKRRVCRPFFISKSRRPAVASCKPIITTCRPSRFSK